MAATTGVPLEGNVASNTALAGWDPACREDVIPEKDNRLRASHARETRAFKQQVFNVVPPVCPDCLSPRSRPKIRTYSKRLRLDRGFSPAEITTCCSQAQDLAKYERLESLFRRM